MDVKYVSRRGVNVVRFPCFVCSYPECYSISAGVVKYITEKYGYRVINASNELWAEDMLDWELPDLRALLSSDSRIFRRKDRKICLRKAS
jgi:hypothetical protein